MAKAKGPRKVHRYSNEFKVKAVQLANLPGVLTQDVAEALLKNSRHLYAAYEGVSGRQGQTINTGTDF